MTVHSTEPRSHRRLPDPTRTVRVSEQDELDVWVLGEGEPLVLVHGAMTRDLLLPLADELVRRGGHQVVHYGRRGHGGHGLPSEAADVPGQAADVVAVLDALGIDKAHVAGHSFGADIALDMAAQAPDRLLSAILLEAMIPQGLSEAAQQEGRQFAEAMTSFAEMYLGGEADHAVTAFLDLTSGTAGVIDLLEPLLPTGARELAAADLGTWFQVDGPALFSWRLDPAKVKESPTAIVWVGSSGSSQGFRDSRGYVRDLRPDTQEVEIAGVGHYFPVLKAAETAEAVHAWCRKVTATQ